MKKILLSAFTLCAFTLISTAQVFTENFETATVGGDVEGYNDWYVSKKAGDALGVSPKIAAGALTYTGYGSSNVGNVAVLASTNGLDATTQRISTKKIVLGADSLTVVPGEKIYVAFLIKASTDSKLSSLRDFVTFEASESSSNVRGRYYAKVTSAGALTFAVSKIATSGMTESSVLSVNDTHLLVAVYEAIDGDNNDTMHLYYNPDLAKTEAEQTNKLTAPDPSATGDYTASNKLAINLRQRGIGAQIGGIRVAKTWNEALGLGSSSIDSNATDKGNVVSTKYFNLSGVEVKSAVKGQVCIQKDVYENGSSVQTKVIK